MVVQQGRCHHKQGLSRSAGKSSTAAAAYRAGVCITDALTGETFDYTRKAGVLHSEMIVPAGAPAELQRIAALTRSADEAERSEGHGAFWNANEAAHKRGDAIVSREIEVDLPHELSAADQKELMLEYAQALSEKWGCGVQASLHDSRTITDSDLQNNPDQHYVTDEKGRKHNGNRHIHLLITTKAITEKGFGNKIKEFDPGERKFKPTLENPVEFNKPLWEKLVQARLDERGIAKIYTTKSLDDTRAMLIEKGEYEAAARIGEPTAHLGAAAAAMERKGEATRLGDLNRRIRERNTQYGDRAALIAATLAGVTSQKSTFTERDLYREICKRAPQRLGDQLHEAVAQCIGREDVVILGSDSRGNVLLTTREIQDMERQMVEQSIERQGEGLHQLDPGRVAHFAQEGGLSDEQTAAMKHIAGADGVVLVEGMAGTGKSTMMKATAAAYGEAGYNVRGCALAGKAAAGLEEGAGIKSGTVHSLLLRIKNGRDQLTDRDVLVVDEAGMLSSNLTAQLVDVTTKAGAKLIMIGDDRQLQPIEAGGAFKAIKSRLGAAKLSTIYRQKDEWARGAVHSFADGDAGRAIAEYAQRGLVAVGVTCDDTKQRLINDWDAQRTDDGRSSIILAGTGKEVADLNLLAREKRIEKGEIGRGIATKTERGDRNFAVGDRIIFLKNNKDVGVKNGQLGTIQSVESDGEGNSRIIAVGDDGKVAAFNTRDYGYIDHGYASTVHKAQGVTVDRAYVLSGGMHDRELSYVSMSRARRDTRLYIDSSKYKSAAALAQQMNQSHQKGTSLDAGKQNPEHPQISKEAVVAALMAKVEKPLGEPAAPAPAQAAHSAHAEKQKPQEPEPVRKLTKEERARILRTPEPKRPNRELIEAAGIARELERYRKRCEEQFLNDRGERPEDGWFVRRAQRKWDEAKRRLEAAIEERHALLWSDDPRAVAWRNQEWKRAEAAWEQKHDAWSIDQFDAHNQPELDEQERREALRKDEQAAERARQQAELERQQNPGRGRSRKIERDDGYSMDR